MSVLDVLDCFVTTVALKGHTLVPRGNKSEVRLLTSIYDKCTEFGIAVCISVFVRGWGFELYV